MANNISISVICPAYNSGNFIIETLNSLKDQTELPNEIIIIDDGSTDDTLLKVNDFKNNNCNLNISLIQQNHLGPGAARNTGILNSTSEWIAFIDSDDIWYNNKINISKKYIQNYPKINFFCHNENHIDLNKKIKSIDYSIGFDYLKDYSKQIYTKNYFSTSAIICKKNLLQENLFNINLSSAQDYELWLRLSNKMEPLFITEILGEYRMRLGNISTTKFWRRFKNILFIKIMHKSKVRDIYFVRVLILTIFENIALLIINKFKN